MATSFIKSTIDFLRTLCGQIIENSRYVHNSSRRRRKGRSANGSKKNTRFPSSRSTNSDGNVLATYVLARSRGFLVHPTYCYPANIEAQG
jgi:hypothetical protein